MRSVVASLNAIARGSGERDARLALRDAIFRYAIKERHFWDF